MRSEKQKASARKYKKKFSEMTFNERVVFKECQDAPKDPDVARGYSFLRQLKAKKEKEKNRALTAIMKMRGIKVQPEREDGHDI
tara:strand:+ start:282 stop:533 length:252 start_codon:yes stop_codon:yes gene_type:complete